MRQRAARVVAEPEPLKAKPVVHQANINKMRASTRGCLACCGLSQFTGMGGIGCLEDAYAVRAAIGGVGLGYGNTNYVMLSVTDVQFNANPNLKGFLEEAGFELLKQVPSLHSSGTYGAYNINIYGAKPLKAADIELIPLPPPGQCQQAHYPGEPVKCTRQHVDEVMQL